MTTISIGLQSCALTLLALYIVLVARDVKRNSAGRYMALSSFATAIYFLQFPGLPDWIWTTIRFVDPIAIGLIWWALFALLEDDFRPRVFHWAGMVVYICLDYLFRLSEAGFYPNLGRYAPTWLSDIWALILFSYLAWVAISGLQDDLVHPRRRLRILIIAGVILATLITTFGGHYFETTGREELALSLTALITIILMSTLILWSARIRPGVFDFQVAGSNIIPTPTIKPQDAALHTKLTNAMENERAWAEPGLTIGALAGKIGAQEHHLRALINRGMGYRNFASFVNGYRLTYAKAVLANLEHARLPVLTIAMDAGFASLAPFNRAFKAAEGKTPTEYRALALADRN